MLLAYVDGVIYFVVLLILVVFVLGIWLAAAVPMFIALVTHTILTQHELEKASHGTKGLSFWGIGVPAWISFIVAAFFVLTSVVSVASAFSSDGGVAAAWWGTDEFNFFRSVLIGLGLLLGSLVPLGVGFAITLWSNIRGQL